MIDCASTNFVTDISDTRAIFIANSPSTYKITNYRPQRSCGQGNVFTGVCLSTGGEGVCLSASWDAIPPPGPGRHPPDQADPPWDQADPAGTRQTPRDQADTPLGPGRHPPPLGPGRPLREADSAYGLRAAGTHPTGMHSCWPYIGALQ